MDGFKAGKPVSFAESSAALTAVKKTPELAFMSEVSSTPLQQSIRHLQSAYSNFFAKKAKFPRFKQKHGTQSAVYTSCAFRWEPQNRNLIVYKLGMLNVHWSRHFTSSPTTATITKRVDDRYFVTLCLDESVTQLDKTGQKVGIDLGINRLATLSTGEHVTNPKHLGKNLAKLKTQQQILSRRKKGSGRWQRQRLRVARLHAHIADSRKDWLDKVTTGLVRRFDVLAIEDLNVLGMVKNHCLARAIYDVGMGQFRRMLEYKAGWYGKEILLADRFFPSSKRCHCCGWIAEEMPLNVREWTCQCGQTHDRDENASHNILAGGQPVKARGEDTRLVRAIARKSSLRRNVNQPGSTNV